MIAKTIPSLTQIFLGEHFIAGDHELVGGILNNNTRLCQSQFPGIIRVKEVLKNAIKWLSIANHHFSIINNYRLCPI